MASITASLLILLSIASPMLTISQELPEVFPSELAQGTHIQAVLEKIKRFCPPFGNSDERFSVTVLGTKSPAIGGCVSMVPPNPDILPSFNLWLGNHKAGGGGKCGDKNMDHFLFECMTKNPLLTDEDTLKGWYVMLYDRTARWSERQDYRCALYETVKEDPPMIKMVISANQSCHGLLKKIKAPEYTVPKGLRHFSDGSIALQISKDLPQKPIWRKKRSEVRGGGCRFPDWSQGSWTDLQVDGSLVRYDSVHHEKDDVDYGQESDYGKEGDVETTGGQQYMQMSQRQKRDLWREPKTKIIEYFRDMQFKTPPKKRVPMEQFSKTNKYHGTTHSPANSIRKKRSTNEDLDEKYNSTEGNDATSVKNTDNLDDFVFNDLIHQWNILQTLPMVTNHSWEQFKRDTADFKKISYYVPFISDQIRKTKDLSKQHNHSEKNPNNEKTKCYCHHNVKDFTPLNDRDQIEIVNKVNKYFPTTKKYSEDLNQKSNFLFDSIQFQKKRQLDVEQDRIEDYLNLSDELKGIERGELTNVEKISQKYPDSLNKSASVPSKIVQRKKREVKHLFNFGEEDINNNKKKCYCYNDFEVFKLLKIFDEMNKYLANTQKHPLNLNKKSNFPFDFDQLHEKKELGNQYIHTKNDTKHRQKRCWGTPAKTTTERYRDAQFENPKRGDPTEPSSKPNEHFGTTQNPADLIRKRRFINEDLNYESESTEDDEEAALRNIKMKDNFNRYMRWRNIVNAISMIKNSIGTSEEKINKNEFEVFPENAPLPPPITYFKFAEIQGIPYREALINWRSLERAYLQKEAEIAYTAYPGQNHPDIVIKDFDQTFDGIEYDFNPLYPEGTDEDPTAYRALTLPDGYHIKPRLSRRATYEQKQLSGASNSATVVSHFQVVGSNPSNYRTNQENTPSLNQRLKRSSKQQNQQQRTTTKFSWSCEMPVVNDEKYLKHPENGVKFLTYGGRIVENNVQTGNDQHNENYSKNTYSCLWLVPRGPNILEYSIIATGMPSNNQSIHTFARQLCSKTRANGKDTGVRNENTLQSRRPSWVTVTRITQEKLVPTRCPVSPGVVFYGVVPAPPPPSTVATNKVQAAPLRLCARLVSSADDCATGQMGPADQMKYTVSECVDQDSSTGTAQTVIAAQTIFEASGGDTVSGSWRRNKRHSAPTDTSTVASSVAITSTSSNMPILKFSSHNTSTEVINNITNHQTTGPTTTFLTAMDPSSTISSRNGIQPSIDITTMNPSNFTTTTTTTTSTTTTTFSPAISQPHETISIDQQIPSLSKLLTTATSPSTSTATVPTTASYHPVTDYHARQQQQWQKQPEQSNNNNNDYYYRGRQQYYPPTPPGNIGTDNNNYYSHQQQHPQTQPHWLPQQHPITANGYSNNNQRQTMDSGGHRIGNYYYRQQQQNYDNHKYNTDQQQQTLQPPHDSSITLQHPNSGSWNVRGDRPLYISGGGGSDNNRNAQVAWNSSSRINSSNNGGWTTAAQQYWWYQQQQRQQEQEKEHQRQQQLQKQRQQQNNRGLGGILSLPPVPLPPLHVEQGTIAVSMPTPLPLHPRRQQKPSNHYYLPTLTTKTSSQLYQLQPKSESRYYQEREYQCLGQWTEPQQQISPEAGEKSIMLTYTYVKRLNPITKEGAQYECFVGTPIPNDEGLNPETTTTILLTEAGTNSKCSRLSDPYRSGMKLVGTKVKKEGACKGSTEQSQDTGGGLWYSLKPQQISPSIPDADNGRGAWYAAHPVPVVAQAPTTMMPILKGRNTGGNGATFTSRQNEQTRRPTAKTNHSIRTVVDKTIIILLAVILITGQIDSIVLHFFN